MKCISCGAIPGIIDPIICCRECFEKLTRKRDELQANYDQLVDQFCNQTQLLVDTRQEVLQVEINRRSVAEEVCRLESERDELQAKIATLQRDNADLQDN